MTSISARPSLTAAARLLEQAGLPTADLTDERMQTFFFAGAAVAPSGLVGLELSPPQALLRSLVVDEQARTGGLGSRLLEHAETYARSQGVRSLYLLTLSAERFFGNRGFVRVQRSEAPPFIRASSEFTSLCPASAAFMVKRLPE